MDIDRQGVEVLSREGFDVVCGNAEDINLEKEFDCIVAGEVMEHLSNFGLFLDNMRQHLKSDGHLVVTVPNAFSISNFYRILRKNKIRVHEEHTCWFDPITLTQLFKRHNFIVVDITFSGNSKWYDKKYFLNIKYKIFRLACLLRDYFSPTVVIVAQKSFSSEVEDQE